MTGIKDEVQKSFSRCAQLAKRVMEDGLLSNEYLNSERLAGLLDDVWQRIPELDQDMLSDQVGVITDEPDGDGRGVCGSTTFYQGLDVIDGVTTVWPDDQHVYLDLENADKLSDPAVKALIAHELAHVILRHSCLTATLAQLIDHQPEAHAKHGEVAEWAADLQVWIWGFSDEMRCLWREVGLEPPSWYHQVELAAPPG